MRVYDCFAYYDEDMLLDMRLNILYPYVDYFIVVEAKKTFTGIPKPLNFDMGKFTKFGDKIRYVVYDGPMDSPDPWVNEENNKNAVMEGLHDARPEDIILFSDVDEIPNPKIIAEYDPRYLYGRLDQRMFNYQLNNLVLDGNGSPREWQFAKVTTYKHLRSFFKSPSNLRSFRKSRTLNGILQNVMRKIRRQTLLDGGWHFSWVMKPERILEKMHSISHADMVRPEFVNFEHIQKSVTEGKDIWGRDRLMRAVPITCDYLPDYVVRNADKYAEYFLPLT